MSGHESIAVVDIAERTARLAMSLESLKSGPLPDEWTFGSLASFTAPGRKTDCARFLTSGCVILSGIGNKPGPGEDDCQGPDDPQYDLIDEYNRKMTDDDRAHGFFDCRITSFFEGKNPADLRLTYHADEGCCYKLRNVSFVGNKRLSEEALREGLPLESGRAWQLATIDDASKAIIAKYRAAGYKYAHIVSAKSHGVIAVDHADKLDLIFEVDEATP